MDGPHSLVVPSVSLVALWVVVSMTLAVLLPGAGLRAEDPKIAYWLHCGGCHRLDGVGAPPEVPTLIEAPGHIEALPGGREYLIRIPGVAQAGLEDSRLAEVLNYMLYTFSSSSLAVDFRPYSSLEVSRHRHRVLKDPLKRRLEIMAAAGTR
jgi:hypothetical protein